ncbi:hypothetical protein [Pyrobaculum sp.]|uniref:hypothetical protein n=1 Tax=Pyrobaculum sp. TaxID=2004705 RepID=UPI003D0CD514
MMKYPLRVRCTSGEKAVVIEKVYEDRYRWRVETDEGVLYLYELKKAQRVSIFKHIRKECFNEIVQYINNLLYSAFKEWLRSYACASLRDPALVKNYNISRTFKNIAETYAQVNGAKDFSQVVRELWDIVKKMEEEGYLVLKNELDGAVYEATVIIPVSASDCKNLEKGGEVEKRQVRSWTG